MRDELVSRELAVILKEKGFDWKCNFYICRLDSLSLDAVSLRTSKEYVNWNENNEYDDFLSIPTQSLAQGWFREKHNISIEVWYSSTDSSWTVDVWNMNPVCEIEPEEVFYKTYELALEAGLMKAVKEVKP